MSDTCTERYCNEEATIECVDCSGSHCYRHIEACDVCGEATCTWCYHIYNGRVYCGKCAQKLLATA